MRSHKANLFVCASLLLLAAPPVAAKPYMIVGNDEKLNWDENGKPVLSPSGRDSVLIVDLEDPENPKIAANLPLKNSVVGPPVNLAINPSGTLALVADSVDVVKDGDALKQVPDTKLYVIDLEASPPKLLKTLEIGKQPSGLDISHDGTMALVALRAENAVGVLSINGKNVELTQKVPVDELVSHVEFTPNGKTAIASKFVNHKVALLSIESNKKVSYNKQDLPVGLWLRIPIEVGHRFRGEAGQRSDLMSASVPR
ncbi:YncE family protein [Methylobacterium sp. WSM2598]|uniref:YncE family protein n=1 Tax=Methylobacterium sp. WSM2598 TaxID=398261 RepID=UPI0018E00E6B|nr:hypothetical protein [Methylobacterium sp. WSM2598]